MVDDAFADTAEELGCLLLVSPVVPTTRWFAVIPVGDGITPFGSADAPDVKTAWLAEFCKFISYTFTRMIRLQHILKTCLLQY